MIPLAASEFSASETRVVPDRYLTLFRGYLAWAASEEGGAKITAAQAEDLLENMPMKAYSELFLYGESMQRTMALREHMSDERDGVRVGRRKHRFKQYRNVFVGKEAVDWMLENGHADTREQAVKLGRQLVKHGQVAHVTMERNFEDAHQFYRFLQDEIDPALVPDVEQFLEPGTITNLAHSIHVGSVVEWARSASPAQMRAVYPAVILWAKQNPEHQAELRARFAELCEEDEGLVMLLRGFAQANGEPLCDDLTGESEALERTCSLVVNGHPAAHALAFKDTDTEFLHPMTGEIATRVVMEKEFVSNAKPAWLSFRDADGNKMLPDVMAKHGDDLRKDLAMQLIFKVCDIMWASAPVEWRLGTPRVRTYDVVVTSDKSGFLEFVPGHTVKDLETDGGWGDVDLVHLAPSAVGSYVAGFVLGVRDRHWENWMVVEPDDLMQIDFGYLLLENPGGFPLDTPRLTMQPALVKLFNSTTGPSGAPLMHDFKQDMLTAFAVLRQYRNPFISFCKVALSNVYDPSKVEAFLWGKHSFNAGEDERKVLEHFEEKMHTQLTSSGVWRRSAKQSLVARYYAVRKVF